jgi:hypothetical protein
VIVRTIDFNDAGDFIAHHLAAEWAEVEGVLSAMPLNLKASDQAGKQGTPIFDPVGTNAHIETAMLAIPGWTAKHPICAEFSFLGTDVDFVKNGPFPGRGTHWATPKAYLQGGRGNIPDQCGECSKSSGCGPSLEA